MIALAAITLTLQLQRTSFDLLDGVAIEIAAHNSAKTADVVTFPAPPEYQLEVLRDNHVIWSNSTATPPGVTLPPHTRAFPPGPTVLAVYIWDAIDSDRSTPGPGDYTIRATLLGSTVKAQGQTTVHFISPVPISAVDKLPAGDVVTIAGTFNPVNNTLTDASGSIALGRRLPPGLTGTVAVRGYLRAEPNNAKIFFVQRFAAMP
jgi:hypothetical protein